MMNICLSILAFTNCTKISVDDVFAKTFLQLSYQYNFDVNCGDHTFQKIDKFGLSPTKENEADNSAECAGISYKQKLVLLTDCEIGISLNLAANSTCYNQTKCSFQANLDSLYQNCTKPAKDNNFDNYFLSYVCASKYIN